jgi:predicted NUDIX family NTP pyrophosphohydrolase
LNRRHVAESGVEPDRVVERLDVVEHCRPCVLPGSEAAAEQVLLERGEEALSDGLVEAVAFGALIRSSCKSSGSEMRPSSCTLRVDSRRPDRVETSCEQGLLGRFMGRPLRGARARRYGVKTDKSGRTSAGILLWRSREGRLEVLLAHQGGPLWVKKDIGHWTIPKGEVELGEEFVAVARREFAEETGHEAPNHPLIDLGQITQKSGKLVLGWAVQGELDPSTAVSNTYDMEWPPHSGVVQTFPEIDRVEWFDLNEARRRLKATQVPFLDRLQAALAAKHP